MVINAPTIGTQLYPQTGMQNYTPYQPNNMYNTGYTPLSNGNVSNTGNGGNFGYISKTTSIFSNQPEPATNNYNTYNNITPPANNTTNIFVTQPSVMTPQVADYGLATQTQAPVQLVAAPTTQTIGSTSSSNDTAMKFMLMMMTMLLGDTGKKTTSTSSKNSASSSSSSTSSSSSSKSKTGADDDKIDTALEAAKELMNHFDDIEVLEVSKSDNKAKWSEMETYYNTTDDAEYKKAFEYFRVHKSEFVKMETLEVGSSDNKFRKSELQTYIDNFES